MKINRIIPFSCVDGPGNRMVIFLQGCNFHCGYCHNPETIHECISCGTCLAACPTGVPVNAGRPGALECGPLLPL
ncbi:MAG: 4Fe-4S cluster-binding domain-containing protein [Selenomonas sp.]|nr:4Fe-4S cluster-binding domain-containing protein [Selenomonas sp.]